MNGQAGWDLVARTVKDQAGWQCEVCGERALLGVGLLDDRLAALCLGCLLRIELAAAGILEAPRGPQNQAHASNVKGINISSPDSGTSHRQWPTA